MCVMSYDYGYAHNFLLFSGERTYFFLDSKQSRRMNNIDTLLHHIYRTKRLESCKNGRKMKRVFERIVNAIKCRTEATTELIIFIEKLECVSKYSVETHTWSFRKDYGGSFEDNVQWDRICTNSI